MIFALFQVVRLIFLYALLTPSLAIPGLPQITFTGGYTSTTKELCTTSFTNRAPKSVPTSRFDSTLRPDVVVVIVQTVRRVTVTPPPTTIQETTNQIVESTTTLLKRTDTFYSTLSELTTVTETSTSTVKITSLFSETATSTITTTLPTKSGWVTVIDSTGFTNFSEPYAESEDSEKHLELRGENPVGKSPHGKAARDQSILFAGSYPAAVTCGTYVMPTWTEAIAFIHGTTTTTEAPRTSTVLVTRTITSISTEAPRAATTLTSTSTFTTTDTSAVLTTEVIQSTTTVVAYATETVNPQCGPRNLLGPRVNDGRWDANFYCIYENKRCNLAFLFSDSAYECCLTCSLAEDCEGFAYDEGGHCLLLKSVKACHPGEITNAIRLYDRIYVPPLIFSNGPCGLFGPPIEEPEA